MSRNDGYEPWLFRRADVRGAFGPYPTEAAPLTFTVPADETPVAMRVSEDGSALFVVTAYPMSTGGVFHVFLLP